MKFKPVAGVEEMFSVPDSHAGYFQFDKSEITAQSFYWENDPTWETSLIPFSTIQGRKGKENVGLLKARFYWPCVSILLDNVDSQTAVDLAQVVIESPILKLDSVDIDNVVAVKQKLEFYLSNKTQETLAQLLYATLYATFYKLEECLMDSSKMKPVYKDGHISVQPDTGDIDAEYIIHATMQSIPLDWDMLQETMEITPLQLVHLYIGIRGGFFEAMNPDYARFYVEKRAWMSKGKTTNDNDNDYSEE